MTTRRTLTNQEHQFCKIAFKNIIPRYLSPKDQDLFRSLASYYEWDGKLSDKQYQIVKNLKLAYDLKKRQMAISQGRLDPNYFKKRNRADYLLARYNPVGTSNTRHTY